MKKTTSPTQLFLVFFALLLSISFASQAQTTIYTTDFGTSATLPSGWTTDPLNDAGAIAASNTYTSSGYTDPTASGGSNLLFDDNVGGIFNNEIIVLNTGSLSTVGYKSIKVKWGGMATSGNSFPGITLEYSTDGSSWHAVSFTDTPLSNHDNSWYTISEITLPADAEGVANLQFRISFICFQGTDKYALDDFRVTGAAAVNYYSKSIGNLEILSNWGTNTDGSGTAPSDFTTGGSTYNIRNNASPTIGANWVVSGSGSKVVVQGTTPSNFTIPGGFSFTGNIDVESTATLTINNTTIPTLGTLGATSTIIYGSATTQTITATTYGNLGISGGVTHNMGGDVTVSGNLDIAASTVFSIETANTLTLNGTITGTGTMAGSTTSNLTIGGTGDLGTIIINSSPPAARAINNLLINRTSNGTIILDGGAISINGILTLTSGILYTNQSVAIKNTVTQTGGRISYSSGTPLIYYGQNSNGQNVAFGTYYALRFSNFNKVLANSDSIHIFNSFTTGNAIAHTVTGSTIDFNGTGAENIPAFNYNNLVSTSTGARTLDLSGTVGVAGAFSPGTNAYTITGSTVDFNGSTAQGIAAFNYNNLTSSSSGSRTLASSGTIGVANVFTPGTNSYTVTGSTVDFNGGVTQNIPSFNFNNLTSSSSGDRVLPSDTVGVAGAFTPGTNTYTITGNTMNYNGSGVQTIVAFNYDNLLSSSTGARTLSSTGTVGVEEVFTPGTNAYTVTGSTVNFYGSTAQTIPAFNYSNLISSSTGDRTLASSGTIGVADQLILGTNTYTVTGSTVDFNGSIAQNIPVFNYYNLTSSSSGNRALPSATVGVEGAFTPGTNAYTITGNTINYNGSGAQTVAAFNYNNLTSSSTGARTLASSGIIGVAGTFNSGTNAYTVTGSTVDFNGSIAQNINEFNYNNLTSSSTGDRVLPSDTVGVAGAFTPGTNTYTVTGNTMNYNGSGSQTITAFNYDNLLSTSSGARTLESSDTIGVKEIFTPGTNAYTVTGSMVNFNGSAAQSIPAFTFYNLQLNNSAGGSTTGDVSLMNVCKINVGTLTATGHNFTILSDASNTGSIATIPGGSDFVGSIIMQRSAPISGSHWRFLSSAVQGATISDWTDNFTTSGFAGATCNPSNCGSSGCEFTCNWPSIYSYSAIKAAGHMDTGWVAATNVTNPISNGKGFIVYLGTTPLTFDVSGAPNKFSQSPTLEYANNGSPADDGWNLVPNPYPCAIDWDKSGWTKTNIEDAIYIYKADGSYASYVGGVGTGGGSKDIASQQAFFVHATAAPTLTMTEDVKTWTVTPVFQQPGNTHSIPSNLIRLVARGNGHSDELVVRFKQGATDNFDGQYDARKLKSADMQNFSSVIADGDDLAINSLPPLTSDVSIPLRLTVPTCSCTSTYSIKDSMLTVPLSSCIVLEDKLTGAMTNLRTTDTYTFTISDTTKAPRFVLHIGASIMKTSSPATCSDNNNGIAVAKGVGAGPWNYTWKDTSGIIVKSTTGSTTADTLHNCTAGVYSVTVTGGTCGDATDTIHVNAPAALASTFLTTNVTCFGGNDGAATVSASGGTQGYSYLWDNGNITTAISNLPAGNYSVTITDTQGCHSTGVATITQPAEINADFIASTYTLDIASSNSVTFTNSSTGATSYEWNFGDATTTSAAVNPIHAYTLAGTYTVMLVSINASCSDTTYGTITVINSNPTSIISGNSSQYNIHVVYEDGNVYLQFALNQETQVNISVYNMVGEKLFAQNNLLVKNNRVKLDFPYTASGMYIAVSEMKNASVSKKIFIPFR